MSTVGEMRALAVRLIDLRNTKTESLRADILGAEWRDEAFDLRLGAAPSPENYLREVRELTADGASREMDSAGRFVLRGVDTCFCHGCGEVVVRGSNAHNGESYCDGCEAAPAE